MPWAQGEEVGVDHIADSTEVKGEVTDLDENNMSHTVFQLLSPPL